MEIKVVLVMIIGYLLGSANSSLIVGKFYRVDVRKHGSGNAGMTNTLRTLGKAAAVLVIIGDILKGVLSCILGGYLVGEIGVMSAGVGAIIGHNWPLYFGFKGGKGILTTFSVVIMMDYRIALILLAIFIVIVAITRYISLGSILCSALFPIIGLAFFNKSMEFVVFSAILAILAIVRHHTNIKRILKGTESKLGAKKSV
ncbi:MAG: glycerol-3-phosphate 1-O-acyltransferase PlsY [Clostridia bacterium]|nr:glycerol-3-phosphate 1-O-acyltransferase PlsY [Clostridia bacterium]